ALGSDPFEVLVRAVELLDARERTAMHHALHQVLTTVAAIGTHRRFGVCRDCCNLTSANPSSPKCRLLGVPIQPGDADLLCVHFQPTSEYRNGEHKYARVWPNITAKGEPPADAKDWEGKPDKADLLSPNPGRGV